MVTREIARGAWMNPAETGFYYLQSRYYDAKVGRFINADDVTILGMQLNGIYKDNLYVYCSDNPVIFRDKTGLWAEDYNGFKRRNVGFDVNYNRAFLSKFPFRSKIIVYII